jgi:hypothetical protein
VLGHRFHHHIDAQYGWQVVVKPHARTLAHPKLLRATLADKFGRSQVHWKDDDDAAPGAEEAFPYVSFTLNMQ